MGFESMNHHEIRKEDSKVLLSGFLVVAFAFFMKLFSYTECGERFFNSEHNRFFDSNKTIPVVIDGRKIIDVPMEYINPETGETVSLVAEQSDSSDNR